MAMESRAGNSNPWPSPSSQLHATRLLPCSRRRLPTLQIKGRTLSAKIQAVLSYPRQFEAPRCVVTTSASFFFLRVAWTLDDSAVASRVIKEGTPSAKILEISVRFRAIRGNLKRLAMS